MSAGAGGVNRRPPFEDRSPFAGTQAFPGMPEDAMPKKIELFAQAKMPNQDPAELQQAVNEWLDAHPNIDNVQVKMSGEYGKAMVMVYYKTTT